MPAKGSWVKQWTLLHLAVLLFGTALFWAGLLWEPSIEFPVPFGAMIVGFPLLFGSSLALALLSGRDRVRAGVNKSLGRTVMALSAVMFWLSATFSLLWVAITNGDWWERL